MILALLLLSLVFALTSYVASLICVAVSDQNDPLLRDFNSCSYVCFLLCNQDHILASLGVTVFHSVRFTVFSHFTQKRV